MAAFDTHHEAKHQTDGASSDLIENLEHPHLGYGEERGTQARADLAEEDNPNVHQHVSHEILLFNCAVPS